MAATDLPRLFDDDLQPGMSVEYLGFHLVNQGNGTIHIQPDGYAGTVGTFDIDEMSGPLEVVEEVNSHDHIREELVHYGDKMDMIDWAGKIMTRDEEKAEEEPEKYLYTPPVDELPDNQFGTDDVDE